MKIHKVLICGDREYERNGRSYGPAVRREIRRLAKTHGARNLLIIEGECAGVDSLSRRAAHNERIHVAGVWALWKGLGRSAGAQRNRIMAALEPDEVIGIHFAIEESKGTKLMLEIAEKLDIPCRLVER